MVHLNCSSGLQCYALYLHGLFFIRFFSFASDYFHSFFSNLLNCWTFFASLVYLDSLFHGSATLTLKLFLLSSVLAYLWTRFSGSAACLVLAPVVLTVSNIPLAYPSLLLHRIQKSLHHVLDVLSLLKGVQPQFFAHFLITFCLDARHHLQGFLLDFF